MSFYVKRVRHHDGRLGWTGPIRSARQVEREADAWRDAGWTAFVLASTPAVRQSVRDWEHAKKYTTLAAQQAFTSQGRRYADYIESHTLGLIAKGKLPTSAINHTLGERLAGNDGA